MAKTTKSAKNSKKDPAKTNLVGKYTALYKRDTLLWFLLTAGCLLLIGMSIFGGIVLYEKWQFNKAEKALDSLYADIVASIGQPVKVEKTKSCGYSSAKYSKGDLSCSINYELQFIGTPQDILHDSQLTAQSNDSLANVSSIDNSREGFKEISFSFTPKNSTFRCGAEYSTRNPNLYFISCSKGALIKHYPERM